MDVQIQVRGRSKDVAMKFMGGHKLSHSVHSKCRVVRNIAAVSEGSGYANGSSKRARTKSDQGNKQGDDGDVEYAIFYNLRSSEIKSNY